ncbi:MAG: AMP-binding protein, partial [Bacteroidales bacterium]|nr:AMP-binding protein [Bacteroidales bacterium]
LNQQENECKVDEVGEICISGDTVFKGYFNHEETTNKVLKNNCLHSGDFGYKDKNGFIYFAGLKKNMINVAGNNIYPRKLERQMNLNTNVISIKIQSEESLIQGQKAIAIIKLKNNSVKNQESFKNWCKQNLGTNSLPNKYIFE